MTPAKAPRRKRGEGQWALGYHEPLNKNEENKKNDDGLNVRQRIIDIYSKQGFDSIDPADLRGRMRWYGLYTQRRPGIDGGKTAVLEPEELDDKYFMLRVRIDGGQLSVAQLRAISDISVKYGRGTADVTDRQNIQLHWIEIESVPAIWEALESVGLSTTEACGDTPRVILGCPLAGLDSDELIDALMVANVRGPFAMIRAFAPLLKASRDGTVVNVSSVSGFTGSGSSVAYCAAKAALDTMTMSLGRALGPEIRVLCVSPGAVNTDFVAGRGLPQLEKIAQATPLKKIVQPDDVARAILACVTHLKVTTGAIIVCDGGRFLN